MECICGKVSFTVYKWTGNMFKVHFKPKIPKQNTIVYGTYQDPTA